MTMERGPIGDLLGEVQARIKRLEPTDALAAVESGACLIDTRSADWQEVDGRIPEALEFPLSVLEWRVDPNAETYDERVGGLERPIVLICRHGFSSSLAVQRLEQLGFTDVRDVIGGFEAWKNAGLPVAD